MPNGHPEITKQDPEGPGSEVCGKKGHGEGGIHSVLVISLPVIRTLSSHPHSSYQRPHRLPRLPLSLLYMWTLFSLQEASRKGPSATIIRLIRLLQIVLSLLGVTAFSYSGRGASLCCHPSCTLGRPCPFHPSAASCLCCYLWAPGRLWTSPTAALTLADLLGMSDVLTYLLFQGRCLRG